MPKTVTLPVLPLTDSVVLPGMVVPIELDSEAQAAVDAAQTSPAGGRDTDTAQLLLVPRVEGRYGEVGTLATVEQVGRLPSGERAAVVRGVGRARVGHGVNGPGAALWVEADCSPTTRPTPGSPSWPASTRAWCCRSCSSAGPGRSPTP